MTNSNPATIKSKDFLRNDTHAHAHALSHVRARAHTLKNLHRIIHKDPDIVSGSLIYQMKTKTCLPTAYRTAGFTSAESLVWSDGTIVSL